MVKATSTKAKSTKKPSAGKSLSADNIRATKYLKNSNIVSICILVSCLTAVFVTLIFNFGMKFWISAEYGLEQSAKEEKLTEYVNAYKSEIANTDFDSNVFRKMSSAGILGLIETKNSGFVYIEPADCNDACVNFREQLRFTQVQKADPVLAVYLEANLSSYDKALLNEIKLNINELPALVYIKGGAVYDRLDNLDSMDNLRDFLGKYRTQ